MLRFKRRQWVLAEETWTSEGPEDHVIHSIPSMQRHHQEGIQTYIRGLTDSFLKLGAAGWREEQKRSPETPGGQSDLDSSASAPPGTWVFRPPSTLEPSGDDHLCRGGAVTLELWAGHCPPHTWPSLKGRGPPGPCSETSPVPLLLFMSTLLEFSLGIKYILY